MEFVAFQGSRHERQVSALAVSRRELRSNNLAEAAKLNAASVEGAGRERDDVLDRIADVHFQVSGKQDAAGAQVLGFSGARGRLEALSHHLDGQSEVETLALTLFDHWGYPYLVSIL